MSRSLRQQHFINCISEIFLDLSTFLTFTVFFRLICMICGREGAGVKQIKSFPLKVKSFQNTTTYQKLLGGVS